MSTQNFQIVSDLHLESNKLRILNIIKPIADNLIVAGDVGDPYDPNYKIFFDYVANNWKNVIYVTGNHEYYNYNKYVTLRMQDIDNTISMMLSQYPNVHFLNNKSIILDDIKIIGSTLWSSPYTTERINDFKYIYDDCGNSLTLEKFSEMNHNCIDYLKNEITDAESYRKVIIVTHFMPLISPDLSNSKYTGAQYESQYLYFGNKLYDVMEQIDLWISGHTHEVFDENIKGTRWCCNAFGHSHETLEYKPMVIDI